MTSNPKSPIPNRKSVSLRIRLRQLFLPKVASLAMIVENFVLLIGVVELDTAGPFIDPIDEELSRVLAPLPDQIRPAAAADRSSRRRVPAASSPTTRPTSAPGRNAHRRGYSRPDSATRPTRCRPTAESAARN